MFELQIFEKPDLIFYQGGYWAKAKLEMSISGFDVLKDLFLKLRRKKVLSYMQKKKLLNNSWMGQLTLNTNIEYIHKIIGILSHFKYNITWITSFRPS